MTPNIGFWPNQQNLVYFLGYGLSKVDETSNVGRVWWGQSHCHIDLKFVKYGPLARSTGSVMVQGIDWDFPDYDSIGHTSGDSETEPSISFEGSITWHRISVMWPNQQNLVYFLGHGLSIADETWVFGKGRWGVNDSITLPQIQDQRQGQGTLKCSPTLNR